MGKGLTINCSMIEQDGNYEIGFHYDDTDGVDIDHLVEGEDPDSMLEELVTDVLLDYVAQTTQPEVEDEESDEEVEEDNDFDDCWYDNDYIKQLEKIVKDLTEENNSLKTDNEILQRRADDAVNKSLNNKKNYDKGFDLRNNSELLRKYLPRYWFYL